MHYWCSQFAGTGAISLSHFLLTQCLVIHGVQLFIEMTLKTLKKNPLKYSNFMTD